MHLTCISLCLCCGALSVLSGRAPQRVKARGYWELQINAAAASGFSCGFQRMCTSHNGLSAICANKASALLADMMYSDLWHHLALVLALKQKQRWVKP